MALTINQIVERSKVDTEEFEVPEWSTDDEPGTVLLRGVSKRNQQQIWKVASSDGSGTPDTMNTEVLNRLLLMHGMVDPVVDEAAYEQLQDGYAGTLDRIVLKIMKLSRFSDADLKTVQRKFPVRAGDEIPFPTS